MENHVCPFWLGYLLLSPLRKWMQNPDKILKPFLDHGMTALDFGSAMGYFSIPMAKMVQPDGRVICVDIQDKMLSVLHKRAIRSGVGDFIETHRVTSDLNSLAVYKDTVDFMLLFAVVHEVDDKQNLFVKIGQLLKPKALVLFSEPSGHVSSAAFNDSITIAESSGLKRGNVIQINRSHTVLLIKE